MLACFGAVAPLGLVNLCDTDLRALAACRRSMTVCYKIPPPRLDSAGTVAHGGLLHFLASLEGAPDGVHPNVPEKAARGLVAEMYVEDRQASGEPGVYAA